MTFKVTKLTVGKGKTLADEKAGEWNRQYFEVEALIEDERQLELAKNSLEALLDMWLRGENISPPEEKPSWDPEKIKWTQAHKGRLTRDGMFYWVFQNGTTVGRKKRGKPESTESAESQLDKVKAAFPQDLQALLSFEVQGGLCIIKARQYLGSENFAKIASVARGLGGEYISAGKDSHFKVPLPSQK